MPRCQDFSIFLCFSDLSKSHGFCPRASGGTSNVKIIEQRIPEIQKTHPFRLTLIGKFLGHFGDRFTGKLIHQKIQFFEKTGRELDRFTGRLIQSKCYRSYMVSVKKFEWMSFPVKRSV